MAYENSKADSDSVNLGSNPSPPASEKPAFTAGSHGWTPWPPETNRAQTAAQKPAQRTELELWEAYLQAVKDLLELEDEIEWMRAENERLRAALWGRLSSRRKFAARAALEGK